MHFFASRGAASTWLDARTDITILTVEEAFKLADEVWLKPWRERPRERGG